MFERREQREGQRRRRQRTDDEHHRIGLIRFGSRVDVYLPAGTAPRVILGQRTVAGETILGQIGDRRVIAGIQQ